MPSRMLWWWWSKRQSITLAKAASRSQGAGWSTKQLHITCTNGPKFWGTAAKGVTATTQNGNKSLLKGCFKFKTCWLMKNNNHFMRNTHEIQCIVSDWTAQTYMNKSTGTLEHIKILPWGWGCDYAEILKTDNFKGKGAQNSAVQGKQRLHLITVSLF